MTERCIEMKCFIPGCTQRAGFSKLTFHRLPSSANLLRRLLLLLFNDLDPSEFPVMKNDNVMCSAHFSLLMSDTDLVHVLVNSMVNKKPPLEAVSIAPKCAAFCCCINLYSDVALLEFPSDKKRFTLWRRVAGWPKMSDCNYLCARHFRRSSFFDEDRRKLMKGAIPIYPTRPYNAKYQNYCPLKKPVAPPQPISTLLDEPEATKPKIASRKKWRCAAKDCDVSYLSHPYMRKINFPSDPERLNLWREVVGYVPNVRYNTSLCTRHFALSQFYDEETRKNFVKLANPVYPAGSLNLNTNDYCPRELDITIHMEDEEGNDDRVAANESVITVVEGSRTSEIILVTEDIKRCSAAGCPVNTTTHPTVKLYDFPETNMRKMLVWLRIAGCPTEKPRRLCERHFDVNSRDLIPKYPFGDLDPETRTYKPVFSPVDPKCCVPGCTSSGGDSNVIFHRFPLEKNVFDAWINYIGCKKLALFDQGNVFRGFRVCSRHFTPNSYYKPQDSPSGSEMVLKPTAVPTSYLGADDYESVFEQISSETEVEFHDTEDAAVESLLEEDCLSEVVLKREKTETEKRKSEIIMVTPDPKRVKIEPVDVEYEPLLDDSRLQDSYQQVPGDDLLNEVDTDSEDRGFLNDCTNTVTFTAKGVPVGTDEESEEEVMRDTVEESSDNLAEDSQIYYIVNVAMRMCNIASETRKLKTLEGKRKAALNVLAKILSVGLTELVNIVGVRFLTNCFSRILDFPLRLTDNDNVISDLEMDDEQKEEMNDELMTFSTILLTFSRRLYSAIAQVASLPSSSRVQNWLICGNGVPGVSRKGLLRLKKKHEMIGSAFLVSLNVVELPMKKEVCWTGKEVFGFVDLGHGRISDVIMEASSVLMFYANSPTHDFQTPLGYCLVNGLSPPIRANLIHLYLLQLHSIGVRCNSVVCEDSNVSHQTYQELGVVVDNGVPVSGYFYHPGNKSEHVFCFVDIDDSFRSVSNLLAETAVFLSNNSDDIRWSDVEIVHRLPQWNLAEFSKKMTRFYYLRSLLLKLKKDTNIFKKKSSTVLKAIKKHSQSKNGTGSSEFLLKMDAIDNLFSGCNRFCEESPAVCRKNVMISLGRARNAITYVRALTDINGINLLAGPRNNFSGLALNLVSLKGYLRRLLISERRVPKMTMMIKTRCLTLRDVRSTVRESSVEIGTAKEFRSYFKSLLKVSQKNNFKKERAGDEGPLHIGLTVSDSYKYAPLNSRCEHTEEHVMKNVVCRWLDETSCSECCFLMSIDAAFCIGPSLTSDVRKLLRTAERCLRTAKEIPLEGDKFSYFVVAVLRNMADFSGFLTADHLFNSVEFGRTSHFTVMVNSLLRIFLRYRIGFMSTTTKVTIRPDSRTVNFQRSAFSL